jgi:REP element-mobilizing transposase RayT
MPNHIHLIWRTKEMNGKEKAQGSFLKYTAHTFKQMLRDRQPDNLPIFKVEAENKQYEFWQRDSLAIHLYSKDVAFQKLDYLHHNPLAEHWGLAKDPCQYKYSSASFYETGEDVFGFLKDLRDEF